MIVIIPFDFSEGARSRAQAVRGAVPEARQLRWLHHPAAEQRHDAVHGALFHEGRGEQRDAERDLRRGESNAVVGLLY